MLAAAVMLQAASPAMGCAGALCDSGRLRPYFDKLAATRAGGPAVHIVQIGDSHTAGDQITGSWRTMLQGGYGSAGRGVMAPGRPYAGYLTRGITAGQSAEWRINGLFGNAWSPGGPPVGLSGYSATSATPGATMTLAADPEEAFDLFTVCALRRPGAGTIQISAGSGTRTVPLDAPVEEPACTTISAGGVTAAASVQLVSGSATITSWATARSGRGGVILSNLGTVGAQLVHFGRANDRVLQRELATYGPDLIVIAFGTNEAFSGDFSSAGFEATLRAEVARLRRFSPGVPILLVGAPDSGTRNPQLLGSQCGGYASPPPVQEPDDPATVQPLPPQPSAWGPTRALPLIQSIQRRVAHELGLAYWDWSLAMGGRCTASAWASQQPPLMRGDHVHFTTPGGLEIARRLQASLSAAAGGAPAAPPAREPFVLTPGGR